MFDWLTGLFTPEVMGMIGQGIVETLYMTLASTALSYVFGLPLGILLVVTDKDGIFPMRIVNGVLGVIVNILRSVPFLILLVAVIPLTRAIVGTSIGSTATIVPLVIAAAPFIVRLVESSIKEVDKGVIEAAQSMGASTFQIIWKVLLPEARPSLIVGSAIAITTILSYSAMAGFVGGGGLGDLAIKYGYYRYQNDVMLITVLVLVVLVQIFQEVGMRMAKIGDKRI
ncbi:MAG TPA: ABC transporter permease [Candidatus Aphodoplasma excrementigallinarum]|uniref:ABC transporter permease n=1 Tax=Candidatus Aphodoplasma excrementigallinarum TaxID=2840673 RepID=A0A9D1NHW1_9FIRM|nr:ABC transporter permease [Candidatus Aphodoplasma excrementigallinarum]